RANYDIGREPQIYKVDAVGYESLMLGLIQPHYGPPNTVCAKGGFPKLTELQLAFSRDGFHWDRTCRETFIGAKPHEKDSWERGYIHSTGGVCNIVDDKLYFYYTAFQGDELNLNPLQHWNGLYANASTGLAVLRRDGFASMEADEEEGILLTRPVRFSGKHLFVNMDGPGGRLYAEVCQQNGKPISGFTRDECLPISTDSTKQLVTWKDGDSLESLAGKPVRVKFYLTNSKIYSFWVSRNPDGVSGGATAAGGPGLTGNWDI
ncbi:MAG: glycosyl hydrolase family 32, partial [Bacteroidota bacterium]|nr:glycosyl hydrolase family 32 [Bacteroidota bacterium]